MVAKYFDDMNIVNLLFDILSCYDFTNQNEQTSVEKNILIP